MEKENKISVIVPVYNREKFIDRCVESIIRQTYKNLEIILVDDGSTDNSGTICDAWAKKDNRIKVFHKENGGVSSARNLGLDNSTGEYIAFVDSDDSLFSDAYMTAVRYMEEYNLDLLAFGVKTIWPERDSETKLDIELFSQDDWEKNGAQFLKALVGGGVVWNKLYKKDIISENNLRFDTKISMGEDTRFNISYLEYADRIKCIPRVLYNFYIFGQNTTSKGMVGYYSRWKELKDMTMRLAEKKCPVDSFVSRVENGHRESLFFAFMLILLPNKDISLRQRKRDLKEIYNCREDDKILKDFLRDRPGITGKLLFFLYKFRLSALMVWAIHIFTRPKKES